MISLIMFWHEQKSAKGSPATRTGGSPLCQSDAPLPHGGECFAPYGSNNVLQKVILYRHKCILLSQGDCRPRPKKTIYTFGLFFQLYRWIAVFVCGRVVYGTRYWFSARPSCHAVFQNIHMRKIRRAQGVVHDEVFLQISSFGDVRRGQMDVFKAVGPCWRTMLNTDMARRTCFGE